MHLPHDLLNAIVLLAILVGTIQCFFGYRIFKVILGLTGFLMGGALAASVGYALSQAVVVAILAGLVGGVIGASLMIVLYYIGIFLMGAFFGGLIGTAVFMAIQNHPEPVAWLIFAVISTILAIIAGVLALIFQKLMIIIATAFAGAWGVVTGIAYFTTGVIDPTNIDRMLGLKGAQLYTILLSWLALGIVGVIVQYVFAPARQPAFQAGADGGSEIPSSGPNR
jgi:hypothetical protein